MSDTSEHAHSNGAMSTPPIEEGGGATKPMKWAGIKDLANNHNLGIMEDFTPYRNYIDRKLVSIAQSFLKGHGRMTMTDSVTRTQRIYNEIWEDSQLKSKWDQTLRDDTLACLGRRFTQIKSNEKRRLEGDQGGQGQKRKRASHTGDKANCLDSAQERVERGLDSKKRLKSSASSPYEDHRDNQNVCNSIETGHKHQPDSIDRSTEDRDTDSEDTDTENGEGKLVEISVWPQGEEPLTNSVLGSIFQSGTRAEIIAIAIASVDYPMPEGMDVQVVVTCGGEERIIDDDNDACEILSRWAEEDVRIELTCGFGGSEEEEEEQIAQ